MHEYIAKLGISNFDERPGVVKKICTCTFVYLMGFRIDSGEKQLSWLSAILRIDMLNVILVVLMTRKNRHQLHPR